MLKNIDYVKQKLQWMKEEEIWPNGMRYLWTDAFGLVLLVSLYRETGEDHYLQDARALVREVDTVLGRNRGYRIGEAVDRHGQYYHYLAMWMYALYILGQFEEEYHNKAVDTAREIHPLFVKEGMGVYWKMKEDLSEPASGYGFGALDHFHGFVVYSLLEPKGLESEMRQMRELIAGSYEKLKIDQDLGLGMMLWISQFYPEEDWAIHQRETSLKALDELWIDPPGYFCRERGERDTKFAFTNFGISVGLQAVDKHPDRVDRLNEFFQDYESGNRYERDAITHVMECSSHFPGLLLKDYDEELIMR